MPLASGSTLGPYTITAELGHGGMGVVYTAHDPRLQRQVAIKLLPPNLSRDETAKQRFLQEAQTASALDHPNICTIYEINETDDGQLYLVMAHYEGETLKKRIEGGRLPLDDALDIATQVGQGLAEAHGAGIVHRDIKPANLLIANGGVVKILDFGLAKLAGVEGVTQTGTAVGTVAYMSPEQARGEDVDHRTDIWALGVVLYEMLSGLPPFQGENLLSLSDSIRGSDPTPLTGDASSVNGPVTRALSKDTGERYQAVADLLAELRSDTAGAATVPVSRPVSRDPLGAHQNEGFWVAVLPFGSTGTSADLEALAEGLSEAIVAGLSRFSYLWVLGRGSTQRYAGQSPDVRTVGEELGARYVMSGRLRQVGARLRAAVQLVDAVSGAQLWSETYERSFSSEAVFETQDDLVPRIVSTVADIHGVLPHSMSEAVRLKAVDEISPYEALVRSFGYNERMTAEDLADVTACLERAVQQAPGNADCWAMLSLMYANEYGHWDDPGEDWLGRALNAARTAVELAPLSSLPYYALAQALFHHGGQAGVSRRCGTRRGAQPDGRRHGGLDGSADWLLGRLGAGLRPVRAGGAVEPQPPSPVPVHRLARCLSQEGLRHRFGHRPATQRPQELLHPCGAGHVLRPTRPDGAGAQGPAGAARAQARLCGARPRAAREVDSAGSRGAHDAGPAQGGARAIGRFQRQSMTESVVIR